MKFQFIQEHRDKYPISVMCHVLEVSASGFYAWRKRPLCARKREDGELAQRIEEAFEQHRRVYGSPRLHAELQAQGIHCGRKGRNRVSAAVLVHRMAARTRLLPPSAGRVVPIAATSDHCLVGYHATGCVADPTAAFAPFSVIKRFPMLLLAKSRRVAYALCLFTSY